MPNVTALTTPIASDDRYGGSRTAGYNAISALAGRNATVYTFTSNSAPILISAHGRIFGSAFNYRSFVSFDMDGNDDDGASISGNTVESANLYLRSYANISGFVAYTANTNDAIYAVKSDASAFNSTGVYNDLDGWVSSGTYDGNVRDYGNVAQAVNSDLSISLNSNAISDINSAISGGNEVKIALLTEDDFLSTTSGDGLGTLSGNNLEGLRFHSTESSTASYKPRLELTYASGATITHNATFFGANF